MNTIPKSSQRRRAKSKTEEEPFYFDLPDRQVFYLVVKLLNKSRKQGMQILPLQIIYKKHLEYFYRANREEVKTLETKFHPRVDVKTVGRIYKERFGTPEYEAQIVNVNRKLIAQFPKDERRTYFKADAYVNFVTPEKDIFPFTTQSFLSYLDHKQKLAQINLTFKKQTGEETAFLYSYHHLKLSTTCLYYKTYAKVRGLVSLEMSNGVSYNALDTFFQNSPELGWQFVQTCGKILSGKKAEIQGMLDPTHYLLWVQILELLLYEEGARYLNSILHVLIWLEIQDKDLKQNSQGQHQIQNQNQILKFTRLPFSLKNVMPLLRRLRSEKDYFMDDIEYSYDYYFQSKYSKSLDKDPDFVDYITLASNLYLDYFGYGTKSRDEKEAKVLKWSREGFDQDEIFQFSNLLNKYLKN